MGECSDHRLHRRRHQREGEEVVEVLAVEQL
jgi:hypothetical protein